MPFSLDQFSLNLVGLSTISAQGPQQIGENLLCESEFCACSGFRRSSRDSSAAALHIGHMLSRVALTGTGRCQTGDYCAPWRGASGGILFERSGLHLAGQLPAVDKLPFEQRRVPPAR